MYTRFTQDHKYSHTHTYSRPVRPFSLSLPFPRGLETVWLQPSRLSLSLSLSPPFLLGKPRISGGVHVCAQYFRGVHEPGREDGRSLVLRPACLLGKSSRDAGGRAGFAVVLCLGRRVRTAPAEGSQSLVAVAGARGVTVLQTLRA